MSNQAVLSSNQQTKSFEQRITALERSNKDLLEFCKGLGNQNADLKTRCENLEVEIKILKQGGNL